MRRITTALLGAVALLGVATITAPAATAHSTTTTHSTATGHSTAGVAKGSIDDDGLGELGDIIGDLLGN
ncbi:hypothetical protein ACFV94_10840 [Streptomyces sp. NPDC059896]|uniref:hypothetical protein n=1 Tax=unclassified Streptomyces TaxID=2593676 RepID=UPI00364F2EDD